MSDDALNNAYLAAAKVGDLPGLRQALAQGADLYFSNGLTAMSTAIQQGQDHIIADLLARGYNPDHGRDKGDTSPLQTACGWGQTGIAQMLLNANADIDYKDRFGDDALCWAVEYCYKPCVDLLLENGADAGRARAYAPVVARDKPECAETVRYFMDKTRDYDPATSNLGRAINMNRRDCEKLAKGLCEGLESPISVKPLRLRGVRHMFMYQR